MSRRHLTEIELVEYADGEMVLAGMDRAEEHLRQCDTCAAALATSRRAVAAVKRLSLQPTPVDLRSRVRAKLAAELEAALSCRQAAPLLHEHIDRCISPILGLRLQRHLESCSACRQELARLEAATHLVRTLTPVAAPARVRERVAAAARGRVRRSGWELRLRPALAIAGTAAVATLALLMRPALQPDREPSASLVAALPHAPAAPAEREAVTPPPVAVAQAEVNTEAPTEMVAASASAEPTPTRRMRLAIANRGSSPRAISASVQQRPNQTVPMVVAVSAIPTPAAMQALRTVATSVEYDKDARRAMDEAAASYAVLHSEDTLNQVPELGIPAAIEKSPERPSAVAPAPIPAGAKSGHNAASGPDEGDLLFGPLV